jgi:polyisoprenyl-phosphate glycosyltransferase
MLSVVIPCHNEQDVLPLLVMRLRSVLDDLSTPYEVIIVDDASTDGTGTILAECRSAWPELRVRTLGTNVGHQLAITAGLDVSAGDYVVTMDADLQDPPEVIPDMLRASQDKGADVVYAKRVDRSSDTLLKRRTAALYYRLMRRATNVEMTEQAGDFRLLSRRVVDVLRALPERHRVYRLLIPWLGFPSAIVEHRRDPRAAGTTKYTVRRMGILAANSVTSFSTAPLRLSTAVGLGTAVCSLLMAVAVVIAYTAGRTVPGWASLAVGMLFLGAVQLLCLGVLGEYVGRIFQEVQRRPLYTVTRDTAADPLAPTEPKRVPREGSGPST